MKLKTFYSNEKSGENFVIIGGEMLHLFKVYRLKVGDKINIISDDEFIYECEITSVKDCVLAKILNKQLNGANIKTSLTVFQCNLKADKMEYLVQKLTELGVKSFIPVLSKNVVKTDLKLDRLLKIAKESEKQSGRSIGLEISQLISFDEMLGQFRKFDKVFVAHEKEKNTSILSAMSNITGQNCAILIGPEGGLDDEEVLKCLKSGAKVFGLGERILRAETAAVCLSAIALAQMGEFNLWELVL